MRSPKNRFWVFDFDGTVSNLVPDRNAAVLETECRSLLSNLARDPDQVVAVISSRSLEDLRHRVNIDRIILAGSSGLEWVIPGSHRLGPDARAVRRLERERRRFLPSLRRITRIPGIELEDKFWSAAIHFRNADWEDRRAASRGLSNLQLLHGMAVHYGPDVAEVQFLAEVSKKTAIKTFVRLNQSRYEAGNILYAGDDQNDAQAIKWVLAHNGIAYTVGNRINIPGSHTVDKPRDLARSIRREYYSENSGKHVVKD